MRSVGGDAGHCSAHLHDLIHCGTVQFLNELAGDLLTAGPDDLVHRGAGTVHTGLDHFFRTLGQVGIGPPDGLIRLRLRDAVIIGQLRGHCQLHAVLGEVHRNHLQGAGLDLQTLEQSGDGFLSGLGGEDRARYT